MALRLPFKFFFGKAMLELLTADAANEGVEAFLAQLTAAFLGVSSDGACLQSGTCSHDTYVGSLLTIQDSLCATKQDKSAFQTLRAVLEQEFERSAAICSALAEKTLHVLAVLARNNDLALVRPLATLLLLALRRGIPAGYWSGFPRRQLIDLLSSTELQATVCGRYVLVRAVTALDVTVTLPPALAVASITTANDDDSISTDVAAALSALARRLLQEREHGATIELVTHQFKQQLLAGTATSSSNSSSSGSNAAAATGSCNVTLEAAAAQTLSSSMPTLDEVCASIQSCYHQLNFAICWQHSSA
jgi:hypothetical protein